jgi:hypothetical protein
MIKDRLVILGGVRYFLNCTQDQFYKMLPGIRSDIAQMQVAQVNNPQKWFKREGRWSINEVNKDITVYVNASVPPGAPGVEDVIRLMSMSDTLGLVYELGSRSGEFDSIQTEGFYICPALDWYQPSILIDLPPDEYGYSDNVEMPPITSLNLLVKELKRIPVHEVGEITDITGPGVTSGSYVPLASNDPDDIGYSGFYESDESQYCRIEFNGIVFYDRFTPNYFRLDWDFYCRGHSGWAPDIFGYRGLIDHDAGYDTNQPILNSSGLAGTDADDEINWEENRAWYCTKLLVNTVLDSGNPTGDSVYWSGGWHYDLVLGTCPTTEVPTGFPFWNYVNTGRVLTVAVPSEETAAEYIEFTLWDEAVGPPMTQPGLSVKIYEYQTFPVYVIILTDTILDSADYSYVQYFAIYKDILYESEVYPTTESMPQPRLHDLPGLNNKQGIADARACVVTIMQDATYETTDVGSTPEEYQSDRGDIEYGNRLG